MIIQILIVKSLRKRCIKLTNKIVEIQGVFCDACDSAGFVMLYSNGDTQVLSCNCENIKQEYLFFEEAE